MSLGILQALLAEPGALVLCTVLRVKGSAPRHAGSKMLVGPQGRLLGSVGGGRGEALALTTCAERLGTGRPSILDIDMQGMEVEGPDMVCGGTSRILVEPLGSRAPYLRAMALLRTGEPVVLVKRLATGETALMDAGCAWVEGALPGANPAFAGQALASGLPVLAEEAGLLYDPLLPEEKLLILGGGHVGCALAALAPGLGFTVTVGDDRSAFLEPRRFPQGVAVLGGTYTDIVARFAFDASTSVVIVTRGHLWDLECVRAVLPRPYRYAGFMGSLRKTRLVLEQVATEGFDPAKVDALRAPIGLELGAETPEELAVAIAAELIAARRKAPCLEAAHRARKARRQTP
jgi:xanthine dehydrogenase accessory factor